MFKKFLLSIWAVLLLAPSVEETLHFLDNHHEICQDHNYAHLHQDEEHCDHDIFHVTPYIGQTENKLKRIELAIPQDKPEANQENLCEAPRHNNRFLRGPPRSSLT